MTKPPVASSGGRIKYQQLLDALQAVEILTDHCTCEMIELLREYRQTHICGDSAWVGGRFRSRLVTCTRRLNHKGNHVACVHNADGTVEEYAFKEAELPF